MMAEIIVATTQEEDIVTSQGGNSMELKLNDGVVDEESPLGGQQEDKGLGYTEENSLDKDFEGSPILLPPGVVLDQPGYMSPMSPAMLVPVGNIQSKGLPSNGVLGNGGVSPPPLQRDDLKAALMQQVEYYFSKDNLATDKYLLSQMDRDNFVPVTIVANFNQVKRLTTDLDLILEVVKESPLLQLDEQGEKIRAIPEKRCILILREIPHDTPQQEIMDLFSGAKCPKFISCEFAENSCWYVTFESEEDAQKAFSFLREEVRTFLGQPIRARIKGTTVQRSSGMPKKPRVNYPMQPMARLQYYPQQPGMMPWASPPSATASPGYFERSNFYIPANGFAPHPFGPPGRFQAYPQQVNGGRNIPPEMGERARGPIGGRGRGDRAFSPPLINGGDSYSDRERDRVGRSRGEHSRDHYRGGGPDRQRYSREEQKIPRLSKNKKPTPSGGPPSRDTERIDDPRQSRSQQSLDLAPVNFPPLPTSEAGGTSPPSVTPTHLTDTSDSKNVSNLADIVKGRKLKENAPPLTSTNHPPLPGSTNTSNTPIPGPEISTTDSNQSTQTQETETPKAITQSTCSSATSSAPNQTQPPSVAAVVASNIPPTPRTISQPTVHTSVSATVSSASTSVTTAASVVASGGQSTVTTTSTMNSGSNNSNVGRPYQSKGSRGDSKGPYRERGYYSNSGKQGSARHSDRDNAHGQNRQNGARNSQVSKEGRQAPPNNRRNRDRDRDRKNGSGYRSGPPRPSPKPLKKHQLPQAPPPPPTPNETKDSTPIKPGTDKNDESKSQNNGKSEKLSYAQMAQRKKAPPSPIPPTTVQEPQTEDTEPPIKSSSAPASPKGERKNSKASTGQCIAAVSKKGGQNISGENALPAPPKPTVSKSAPTSPSKEAASVPGGPLPLRAKDD